MTKTKALYQAKLILDTLSKYEYNLLPQDDLKYIEQNMEYDENIKIDANIPLENQNIDDKTFDILEKILNKVDKSKLVSQVSEQPSEDINDIKQKNIILMELLERAKKENEKIPKIKELVEEYKKALQLKEQEIANLKQQNEDLFFSIKRIPKLFRKIFFKQFEQKMLK